MKKTIKTCPHCNEKFESNHARRIYCSDSHRVAAYNKKKGFKVMLVAPEEKHKGKLELAKENSTLEMIKAPEKKLYDDSFGKQIGASALGSVTANLLINAFTRDENKPVTKKNLIELFNAIRDDQIFFKKEIIKEIKNGNKPNDFIKL